MGLCIDCLCYIPELPFRATNRKLLTMLIIFKCVRDITSLSSYGIITYSVM